MKTRYLVTSALPYINGIKHLGNLIGSILPADVYTKYLRQQGEEVLFICGTDEHGTPAELAASEAGLPVDEYCKMMYQKQKEVYQGFHINFDYFGRTSCPANAELVHYIYQQLDKNGFIEEKEICQVYSLDDKRFLPDRYVEGTCPYCAYTKARGDQCESCGKLLDTTELIEPRSAISGSQDLEIRSSKHLFLNLSLLQDRLQTWIEQHQDWPSVTAGIAKKWLNEGLSSRCISRDLSWGISIPREGFENKVFYVWFDAPIGYIGITKEYYEQSAYPDEWKKWWMSDTSKVESNIQYTQFMAKDNVPFHAIFFPAVLLGTNEPWKLVDYIKGFNWLTYEGGKFSTSSKRGVFLDQALEIFPGDYWRYYLLANAPESSDSDFRFEDFANCINKDLADILGNFIARVSAILIKHFDSLIPAIDSQNPLLTKIKTLCASELQLFDKCMRACEYRESLRIMRRIWVLGNAFITEQKPWDVIKYDKEQAAQIIGICCYLIRLQAVCSYSIIPNTSQQIALFLGLKDSLGQLTIQQALDETLLPCGHNIFPQPVLVKKIEPQLIDELKEKFSGQVK